MTNFTSDFISAVGTEVFVYTPDGDEVTIDVGSHAKATEVADTIGAILATWEGWEV